eukprot:jgi/Astpho2/2605/e_gw1.00048.94.1_t
MTAKHGYRIAVIVNEYGEEVGIESASVQVGSGPAQAADWVELGNGCLCCSVKSEFVRALDGLAERKGQFDYILVETTGLADPGPVAAALWPDEEIESSVRLDAIVTVVDAKHVLAQLHEQRPADAANEAQQQVAYADVVLLNKVDLVPEETQLQSIEQELLSINSDVAILRCVRSFIDLGQILNSICNTKGRQRSSLLLPHRSCSRTGLQEWQLRTTMATRIQPTAMRLAPDWLDKMLWEGSEATKSMYRIKGLLSFGASQPPCILQAVHELYDLTPAACDPVTDSKVVFIGRQLDKEALHAGLLSCIQ